MLHHRDHYAEFRRRWPWLIAAVISCAGAGVLIYFGRAARPLWVDEEMLALNVRDRSFTSLTGSLWLGQAAPLGWLALERVLMLTLGFSERAIRALPVGWGLLTLAAAALAGRRWLGPAGVVVLALLFAFGNHVWFFALELKQYSADTFGGLALPALAAWALEAPTDGSRRPMRRADAWWIVAGMMQWFSYGALFVAPACGAILAARTWQRSGRRAAFRTAAFSLFWVVCAGVHYYLSIRHASDSPYLRGYWAPAFPPVAGSVSDTLRWFVERVDSLSSIPGGTRYSASFWVIALAGLALGVRAGSPLALMLATAAPAAVLLAAYRLVPLSGRLSLWVLPSLYLGIALAADAVARAATVSIVRRRWLAAAGVFVCGFFVVRLCADIYRTSQYEIKIRPQSAHGLDDRSAIRMLMKLRQPGDAMLVTHLGLPAVWWYGGVNLSDAGEGASFPDGGAIFEVWQENPGSACRPDDLSNALKGTGAVAMYLGFELGDHLEEVVLDRLAELGALTTYRRFAENGHTAVVDLRRAPTGRIQVPAFHSTEPLARRRDCVSIRRAHRW